ncbi:MAG: FAD-dependent oxidoreductase [Actinobacteria bacterium]|nr:FAD-dependent oxidoreductase [Actinomycetota bacterium]
MRPQAPVVQICTESCVGCSDCVWRCPAGVLSLQGSWATVEADTKGCIGCRICERACPYNAIEVTGAVVSEPSKRPQPYRPATVKGSMVEVEAGFASLEAAQAEAARCLKCPDPMCVWGCPARNDIPGFLSAVERGDLEEAYRIITLTSIFPGVCSRVCDRAGQCEGACALALAGGDAVAIGLVERFVADSIEHPDETLQEDGDAPAQHNISCEKRHPAPSGRTLRVAVIGGGPGGMSAAWWLARGGTQVDLFESGHTVGGVLAWGIPGYALPEPVAKVPAALLAATPEIQVKTGFTLGKDASLEDLLATYDAVVLAHGASLPPNLDIPGHSLPGVEDARSFLQMARAHLSGQPSQATSETAQADYAGNVWEHQNGKPEEKSRHQPFPPTDERSGNGNHDRNILVVGGGDTAMAVARTALRLGMHATSVRRSPESSAKVRREEVASARAEGVDVRFRTTVKAFRQYSGTLSSVIIPYRPASQIWRRGIPRRGIAGRRAEEVLPLDLVVIATGFSTDQAVTKGIVRRLPLRPKAGAGSPLENVLKAGGLSGRNGYGSDLRQSILEREAALTLARHSVAGRCWVVGDALAGPASVIEAVAQGREAAASILSTFQPRRLGEGQQAARNIR